MSKPFATEPSPRRRYGAWLVWLLAAAMLIASPLWAQMPGTWDATGNLGQARAGHTATLLPNGKVLIAGGVDATGHALSAVEIYDPSRGPFGPAVTAHQAGDHRAVLHVPGEPRRGDLPGRIRGQVWHAGSGVTPSPAPRAQLAARLTLLE